MTFGRRTERKANYGRNGLSIRTLVSGKVEHRRDVWQARIAQCQDNLFDRTCPAKRRVPDDFEVLT